jgi:hypothetical protein
MKKACDDMSTRTMRVTFSQCEGSNNRDLRGILNGEVLVDIVSQRE